MVPPIGAQGLNMSLADIATLVDLATAARAAGGDIGAPELLARYHRARHGDMLVRIAGIDLLNRAAMAGPRPLRDLRRAGLKALHGGDAGAAGGDAAGARGAVAVRRRGCRDRRCAAAGSSLPAARAGGRSRQ